MKKFEFRFSALLRSLENKEEKARKDFAEASGRFMRGSEKLTEYSREYEEYQDKESGDRPSGSDIEHMRNYISYMFKIKGDIYTQKRVCDNLRAVMEKKRKILAEASREKKSLEILRDKKYRDYKKAVNKEYSRINDEIGGQLYNRKMAVGSAVL
ncbi:MAG: flagellar export protein FliJ [Fibrobacterota bacterium]